MQTTNMQATRESESPTDVDNKPYSGVIGTQQSPIVVQQERTFLVPDLMAPEFDYQGPIIGCFTQDKPGHNVFSVHDSVRASIKFRGISARLKQIHLHGFREHQTVPDISASGEIHFVHAISTAQQTTEPSNYIVLSAFLQIESRCEKAGMLKLLKYASGHDDDPNCPPFPAEDLSELTGLKEFFYYRGSLTGPPYSEDVTWILFRKPLTIAPDALALLKPATHGARSVQPENRRIVLRNFA